MCGQMMGTSHSHNKLEQQKKTHIKMLSLISKQSNIKYNSNEIKKLIPDTLAKFLKSNNTKIWQ